jgi:ADP-heptose:LPS heptosyltransferase
MVELAHMAGIDFITAIQSYDREFNIQRAFNFAAANNLHMIQANFAEVGLPIPKDIPRPHLFIQEEEVPEVDYILSPFSRSLPEHERWQQYKWQMLIDRLYGKSFAIIGGNNDDRYYLTGCLKIYGKSLNYIANVLLHSKGLISVTTGTSHLAYALGVKNYLFCSQGAWGKNPEAVQLTDTMTAINSIPVEKVISML